ncbi:hypothetical protein [Chitinophaga arvensicola]|uniref:Uncharacterized protein n=1 Tax=Chitinophaga arvensicola TaxID=29529 RepID=A0A1I0S815_9BACT|nr:hypothetical protein [Chitinophaga arvensicola]SEW51851.1 hypothetical protein SAMN04488122_4537 [Chitinophaga arvensicola]
MSENPMKPFLADNRLIEKSVLFIENNLNNRFYDYKRSTVVISPYHSCKKAGALCQVGLLVQITSGRDFQFQVIYEYGQQDSAGIEELRCFIRKIDQYRAYQGCYIAHGFLPGCVALAASDPRIKIFASGGIEFYPEAFDDRLDYFVREPYMLVQVILRSGNALFADVNDYFEDSTGERISCHNFINYRFKLNDAIHEKIEALRKDRVTGTVNVHCVLEEEIAMSAALIYGGQEIRTVQVQLQFDYYLAYAVIQSSFDAARNRRIIEKEIRYHNGESLRMQLI